MKDLAGGHSTKKRGLKELSGGHHLAKGERRNRRRQVNSRGKGARMRMRMWRMVMTMTTARALPTPHAGQDTLCRWDALLQSVKKAFHRLMQQHVRTKRLPLWPARTTAKFLTGDEVQRRCRRHDLAPCRILTRERKRCLGGFLCK